MASELHIVAVTDDDVDGGALVAGAVVLVEDLEARWSRFLVSSDISRINLVGASGGGAVVVDRSTSTLLDAMVAGFERTSGRFDPTQLRAVLTAGYTSSIDDPEVVCPFGSEAQATGPAIFDLLLDVDRSTVTVPAGLGLDAGGIGKGLAADLAVDILHAAGASGALVSIGGDLSCRGRAPRSSGWLVDVEAPGIVGSTCARLALDGGGVATSSVRSRRWIVDGEERHHQIDPATGACSDTDLEAVTVVASTGWLAEVHATAALAAGSTGVVAYLEGHGLSGLAHAADGRILSTADLSDLRELRPESVR